MAGAASAIALWTRTATAPTPSCSYTGLPPAWRSLTFRQKSAARNASLQVCAALREESLPKKKHKETEDLLAELEDELQPFLELQRESALNLRTMRHYEIMYLVHEAKVGELQDVIQKFTDYVKEKKGRIWRLNDWGMRRLAYKIKKTWRANYILMNLQIGSEYINELNMLLEKDERVIRHMIITRKKAITKNSVPPEELPPTRAELLEAELAAEAAGEQSAEDEEEGEDEDEEEVNEEDEDDEEEFNEEDEDEDDEEEFNEEDEDEDDEGEGDEDNSGGEDKTRRKAAIAV